MIDTHPISRLFFKIFLIGSMAIAAVLVGCGAGDGEPEFPVSFNRNVAPIIHRHCSNCHRPGEAAPFNLLDYDDVKRRAKQIVQVTHSRLMPPWLPERGQIEFANDRSLTDEQIAMIRRWVDQGAPQGDPADHVEPPTFTQGWQLGQPDLIVTMPEPYILPATGDGGRDVYRNFVVPIPTTQAKWVRAMEFRPGNPRVVHHAFMQIDPTTSSLRLDEDDKEIGFAGMAPRTNARIPEGSFNSWQPGRLPTPMADDCAWKLQPHSYLVLQIHMQPTGKPESLQCTVGIYFTDKEPTKFPTKLVLRPAMIDIPPGDADHIVTDEYQLPVDLEVLSVSPHTHYLGKRLEGWATLPDGRKKTLLTVPQWDFDWQGDFTYAKPFVLPKGTVISMRYQFDNSAANPRNPSNPPKRVRYGVQSVDEMAEFWLVVVPRHKEDSKKLSSDVLRATMVRILQRQEILLAENPNNLDALIEMGRVRLGFGHTDRAFDLFEKAAKLAPDSISARHQYGAALMRRNEYRKAKEEFDFVLKIDPNHIETNHDLGSIYLQQREYARACERFEQVFRRDPASFQTHLNMALALAGLRDFTEAKKHVRIAYELRPEDDRVIEVSFRIRSMEENK